MGLTVESSFHPRDRQPRWRLWDEFPQQERSDILETLESVKRILAPEAMPALDDINDFGALTLALNAVWTTVSKAVNGDFRSIEAITSSEDLVQLLFHIHGAESIVQRIEARKRTEAVSTAREALSDFRGSTTVEDLVNTSPGAVSKMGFDRTMLSLVDGFVWTPRSAYVDGDPEWAEEIVMSGRSHPQQLVSSLPEFELMGRRNGILVSDAQNNSKVNKHIVEPSLSRSYVATALKSKGQVLGFLHCDQFFHHRDTNEFDRDLLNLFAEGFSYVLDRALLLERADSIRVEIEESTKQISAAADGFIGGNSTYITKSHTPSRPPSTAPAQQSPSFDVYRLTRREADVLQLMVDGKSNGHIADSMAISTGTVKTHVKHILRKLGVSNRAEAIACWFNSRNHESDSRT